MPEPTNAAVVVTINVGAEQDLLAMPYRRLLDHLDEQLNEARNQVLRRLEGGRARGTAEPVSRRCPMSDAALPSAPPLLGNILLPRDRASALAFLNGMLAMYDALIVVEGDHPGRGDILAVRQHYLDLPVEP